MILKQTVMFGLTFSYIATVRQAHNHKHQKMTDFLRGKIDKGKASD